MSIWEKEDYSEFIFGVICALLLAFALVWNTVHDSHSKLILIEYALLIVGMFASNVIGKAVLGLVNKFKPKQK